MKNIQDWGFNMLGNLLTSALLGNPNFLTASKPKIQDVDSVMNAPKKVKMALAVKKDDFYEMLARPEVVDSVKVLEDLTVLEINKNYLWKQFCSLPTRLLERPACETDESHLQIIPYIVLRADDYETTGNVFCYKRGNGGGEARLMSNYSVGYGGHIEDQIHTADAITDCMVRELFEEIGLSITDEQAEEALKNCTIFHDTSNDVGKVHLALLINIQATSDDFGEEEIGCIENTHLTNASTLLEKMNNGELDVEVWSQLALGIDKRMLAAA